MPRDGYRRRTGRLPGVGGQGREAPTGLGVGHARGVYHRALSVLAMRSLRGCDEAACEWYRHAESVGSGTVRESVWDLLAEVQRRARDEEDGGVVVVPGHRGGLRVPTIRLAGVHLLAVLAGLRADGGALDEVSGGAGAAALGVPAFDGDRCGAGPGGAAAPPRPLRGAVQGGRVADRPARGRAGLAAADGGPGSLRRLRSAPAGLRGESAGVPVGDQTVRLHVREGRPGGPYLRQDGARSGSRASAGFPISGARSTTRTRRCGG